MYGLRPSSGLGDIASDAATASIAASTSGFFDASCPPGSPGCVPHWYCYIPFMATPDCLASFSQGVKEMGGAVGSTVGGTVGSAVGGAIKSTVEGIINPQGVDDGSGNGTPSGFSVPWWVWLAGGLGVFALVAVSGGSPRRYGR